MDAELSRIAADVLRPGEQILWAGKPVRGSRLPLPPYFGILVGGFLLLPILIYAVSSDHSIAALVINLVPIVFIFGLIALVFAKLRGKYASAAHNTFLLTENRAVHVFSHAQVSNVASVPLRKGTSVRLFKGRSTAGDLLIRRKAGRKDGDAATSTFMLGRSAWAGIRFSGVPHAEHVRDVAERAIAKNQQFEPKIHENPGG